MNPNPDYSNIFEAKMMIFDFDGVIVDSMNVKVDEYKILLSQFTKDELVLNRIEEVYRNSMGIPREVTLKKVFDEILGRNISAQEIENLSQAYSKAVFERLEAVKPLSGFLEYLALHKEVTKHIISGAPHSDIIYLADKLNLAKYFKSIKGGPLAKKDELKRIKTQEKVKEGEVIYFGDQENDYNAAKSAEVQFVGINASPGLQKLHCKCFSDFQELIDYEITSGLCAPNE